MVARSPLFMIMLVPLLPLLGAIIIATFRRSLKGNSAGMLGTLTIGSAFALSVMLFLGHDPATGPQIAHLFDWIHIGGMNIPFAFQVDALSLTMMLIVTGVGTLIHLYSIGYMHDDQRVSTFFALLNLFTFAMLVLVMGANYVMTFIGWEGVGLCSYLLIGFWYTTPAYNYAARKAFVMNRIGDLGFVLGLAWLFSLTGTLSFSEVFDKAGSLDTATLTGVGPAMASGSQVNRGICALLPVAPRKRNNVAAIINGSFTPVAAFMMASYSRVPKRWNSSTIASTTPTSPMRFITKALRAA